jgi:hypothetical protein
MLDHLNYRADQIQTVPQNYRFWLHLGQTVGICLCAMAMGLVMINELHQEELLTIPITILSAIIFEWYTHRYALHRAFPGLRKIHELHIQHHMMFHHDTIQVSNEREYQFVLLPAFGMALLIAIIGVINFIFAQFMSSNVAWLAFATQAGCVLYYELAHLSFHLPLTHPLMYLLKYFCPLKQHHVDHHNPAIGSNWNFGITNSWSDRIFGTKWKP